MVWYGRVWHHHYYLHILGEHPAQAYQNTLTRLISNIDPQVTIDDEVEFKRIVQIGNTCTGLKEPDASTYAAYVGYASYQLNAHKKPVAVK